jgi:hypothetical protein
MYLRQPVFQDAARQDAVVRSPRLHRMRHIMARLRTRNERQSDMELDNGIVLPDFAMVTEKLILVQTFEEALEVGRLLGDDTLYGIQITDPAEEMRLIHALFMPGEKAPPQTHGGPCG